MSMQKKENQCHCIITNIKKSQKVNEKSKGTIYLCTQLLDTLVTPIPEYGIELWGFKGLKKLEKNRHTCKFLQIYLKRETIERRKFCL